MPLISEVRARVPEQTLAELTRQKSTAPGSVDTTILQRACDDVEGAWMPLDCGVEYDGTDLRHVVIAVEGVVIALRSYLPAPAKTQTDAIEKWQARCKQLKLQTQLDRIVPMSTSILETSSEVGASGVPVLPDGDRSRFEDMIPRAPTGAQQDDTE